MKKFVAWKIGRGIWKGTSAENYNAQPMNANKIVEFRECWTDHDVKTCVKMYLGDYEVEIK